MDFLRSRGTGDPILFFLYEPLETYTISSSAYCFTTSAFWQDSDRFGGVLIGFARPFTPKKKARRFARLVWFSPQSNQYLWISILLISGLVNPSSFSLLNLFALEIFNPTT
jgi:hypothetical protein